MLPNLSLTYIESAGEFRRIEWSLPPEQTPVPVVASVPDSAIRPGALVDSASGAHQVPLDLPAESVEGARRSRRGRCRLSGSRLKRSGPQPASGGRRKLDAGDRVGPYVIEQRLGEGGMGLVFKARDPSGREVALKLVRDELVGQRGTSASASTREARRRPPGRFAARGGGAGHRRIRRRPLHGPGVHLWRDAEGPDRARGLAPARGRRARLPSGGEGPRRAPRRPPRPPRPEAWEHPARRPRRRPHRRLRTRQGPRRERADQVRHVAWDRSTTWPPSRFAARRSPPSATSTRSAAWCTSVCAGSPRLRIATACRCCGRTCATTAPDACAARADLPADLGWAVARALEKEPERRPPSATAYARMVQVAAGVPPLSPGER